MKRAIFFDRDGLINPLVARPDGRHTSPWSLTEFTFLPHVEEAFALVGRTFSCFIVTNQPHLGREMSQEHLNVINMYLYHALPDLVDIAYSNQQGSFYYKPNHGMVLDLVAKHTLSREMHQHYFVGDRWKDIVCGHKAGTRTIFVGDKYDDGGSHIDPDYIASNIYTACQLIMSHMEIS